LLFSSGIGLVAYRRQSLEKSGVLAAIASGTSIVGLGGWSWGRSLIHKRSSGFESATLFFEPDFRQKCDVFQSVTLFPPKNIVLHVK
jgi:hypothetical protein